MDIDYYYFKKRGHFGKPYYYANDGPHLVNNLMPDKTLGEKYITKNPVNKATQENIFFSAHEVNTWRPDFKDSGMFHDQGGWPKEINLQDEEAVLRYRKKLEREDNYIAAMKHLTKPVEHAIKQNNAINIYQKYFEDVVQEYSVNESLSQLRNIYRDTAVNPRPVNHLSWCPDKGVFATTYYNTKFQMIGPNENTEAYIWDIEIPNAPNTTFDSKIPIVALEWNPMDRHCLVGGLHTGQIACYDIRKAPEHMKITNDIVGHRDPVHSLLWINSKSGMEFFSTSSDGEVKWWDCRYLDSPTDSLILDVSKTQNINNAYSASCLEYDPSIPAKFLVGTESGHLICGNRKGTSISEKLPWVVKTNLGPIYSIQRNAAFSKNCLVIGDWSAKIWSEDCKESAIMWIKPYKFALKGGEWSKSRYSVFFVIRSDGVLDLWDLLQQQIHPFVSMRISQQSLTAIRVEEEGQLVVVGDETGKCYLVSFAQSLATSLKNDKVLLSSMFDRETRREKILETRMKELRLAMKLKAQLEEEPSKTEIVDKTDDLMKAEEDYWDEIEKVLNAIRGATKKKEDEEEEETKDEDQEEEVTEDRIEERVEEEQQQ